MGYSNRDERVHLARTQRRYCLVLILFCTEFSIAAPATTEFWKFYSYENAAAAQGLGAPSAFVLNQDQKRRIVSYLRTAYLHRAGLAKSPPATNLLNGIGPSPVHISLKRKGGYLTEAIASESTLRASLDLAVERAVAMREVIAKARKESIFRSDLSQTLRLRVTFFYNPISLDGMNFSDFQISVERGIHGLGLFSSTRWAFVSSSKPIVHNYSHEKLFQRLAESLGTSSQSYIDDEYHIERYDTLTLLQMDAGTDVLTLTRDDIPVALSQVSWSGLESFQERLGGWLLGLVGQNGRMEYKYIPSRGSYSDANNMIRQWMATLALAELYKAGEDIRYAEAWRKNVEYNLSNYYVEQNDYGHVHYANKSKLGSISIAMMALGRGPNAKEYLGTLRKLRNSVDLLWQDDGSFRTFLLPPQRNDNQTFYPGEALLALMTVAPDSKHSDLHRRVRTSMDYYMRYYRSNGRNTAFIPWHTMAYWHAFQSTGDAAYRRAIYEMNDWLINIQDIRKNTREDVKGRFFLPEFSSNGPPHASSTAVYVEGLAYAYDLAKRDDNQARANAYLQAIRYGIRSLMQLEFTRINSYYLKYPRRVVGGLRTRVTDNQLRIDNTQHAVMAIVAAQRFLKPDDLRRELVGAIEFRADSLARYTGSSMAETKHED